MLALLVHNPKAGDKEPSPEQLLAALKRAGFTPTYQSSKTDDLDEALARPTDLIVLAGGDGTVARVARKLPDRTVPIAILPIGTANNIARCLGIQGKVDDLVAGLTGAAVESLDIGRAVGPWGTSRFVEGVGFGALAKAIDDDGPKPPMSQRIEKGREAFAKALIDTKPERYVVEADGEAIDAACMFVEVLNLGMTGPRVMIGPSARPGDQLLDVVYLTADRLPEMLAWLKAPEHRPPPVEVIKAREVKMIWKRGRLRIDDEVFAEPATPCDITIGLEPESLLVYVPTVSGQKREQAEVA
ncbi:MAG: diacylglycerol/lipid kinase family protein [Methyloceanibacter sp.]